MQRPTFIDLRSKSSDTLDSRATSFSPRPSIPSPRMQHLAGDRPPAMSPLDMFAAHSRLLARQLDESTKDGKRVSRLPPLSMADPINRQRTVYGSRSAGQSPPETATLPKQRPEEITGALPEVEEPQLRPRSVYPRVSHVPLSEEDDGTPIPASDLVHRDHPLDVVSEQPQHRSPQDYFSAPRTGSPEPAMMNSLHSQTHKPNPRFGPSRRQQENGYHPFNFGEPQRGMSVESRSSKASTGSLYPPKSPHVKQASIRSIPMDSSDDENSASTNGSGFSQNRKLSSSSNVSMPNSPFAPFAQTAHGRSPSLNSEYSIGGSHVTRQAFNFSRPISRASQPSVDMVRQPSFDSRPSLDHPRPPFSSLQRSGSADSNGFLFVDEPVHTPLSLDSPDAHDSDGPAPSYIDRKFTLPRGRMGQKGSRVIQTSELPQLEWGRPSDLRPSTPLANQPMSPGSPSSLRKSPKASLDIHRHSPRPSFDRSRPSAEQRPTSSPRPSTENHRRVTSRPSGEQPQKIAFQEPYPRPPPTPLRNDDESQYTASTRSGSTIKAPQRQIAAMSTELTAEDHLAKGITLHERGEARESTYHLRIAAKQDLPTAMLLYALACRHGWGMRPNPQEGVQWLRKAADCASTELAVEDDHKSDNIEERKTRRAQFALSIYELGQSHYNGWGIEQDRVLALRCFEIAANWGDADAMAEAGFCYAKGEGTKKDLKKAAKYYRMAEGKGMSMVGNSW